MVCASGAPGRQGVEKPDREQCRVRRCSSSLVHQTRRVQQVPVRVVAPFAHRERRRVFDELFGGGSGVFIGRAAPWTSSPLSIRSSQSIAGRRTVRLPAAQGVGGGPEHRQAFGQRRAGLLQDSARDLRDACGVPGSSPSTITAMSMSLTAATKPSCARLPIRYADTSRGPNTVRAAATASLATSRPCCSSAQLAR